jgi:hypothetical protein
MEFFDDLSVPVKFLLAAQPPDHWHRLLLSPRRQRPRRRAPESRDEVPSPHQ